MSLSRRKFTKEFNRAAVRRLEMGASMAEVARAFELNANVLHRWRREFRQGVDQAFPSLGKRKAEESRVAELERKIGQQTLEIDFFGGCLAASRGGADAAGAEPSRAIYRQIGQEAERETAMTIVALCASAHVSGAGFYRQRGEPEKTDGDLDLRDQIQKIALEMPSYGRRRIAAELKRRGWKVNHKRARRIMRADNPLCLRRRKFGSGVIASAGTRANGRRGRREFS